MWKSKNLSEKSHVKKDAVLGSYKNNSRISALNFWMQYFDINLCTKHAMVPDTDQT